MKKNIKIKDVIKKLNGLVIEPNKDKTVYIIEVDPITEKVIDVYLRLGKEDIKELDSKGDE